MQVNLYTNSNHQSQTFGKWIEYQKDYLEADVMKMMLNGKYKKAAKSIDIINQLEKNTDFIFSYESPSIYHRSTIAISKKGENPFKRFERHIFDSDITSPLTRAAKFQKKLTSNNHVSNLTSLITKTKELLPTAQAAKTDASAMRTLEEAISNLIQIDVPAKFKALKNYIK